MEASIKTKVVSLIEKRVEAALKKMGTFTGCKEVYDSMKGEYPEQMECFRNLVFWTIATHPNWTEEDVLTDIISKLNKE